MVCMPLMARKIPGKKEQKKPKGFRAGKTKKEKKPEKERIRTETFLKLKKYFT